MDYVLEKVFNPARNWMRGREDPRQRIKPKFPYREFLLKNSTVGEISA